MYMYIYILVLVLADYPPSWREQLWAQQHRIGGASGTGGPAYSTPASHTGTWPDAAEENRSSQSGWLHPPTSRASSVNIANIMVDMSGPSGTRSTNAAHQITSNIINTTTIP